LFNVFSDNKATGHKRAHWSASSGYRYHCGGGGGGGGGRPSYHHPGGSVPEEEKREASR